MGSDRRDSRPAAAHGGSTAPGLGGPGSAPRIPASDPRVAASAPAPAGDPVDFDALSAALSPAPRARARSAEPSHDSHGRSSAAYASRRPHSVPPARVVPEPADTPAVIVAADDTVPSGPPHRTIPLGAVPPHAQGPSSSPMVPGPPGSSPHHVAASPHPLASPLRAPHQRTIRMPDRPRLPRTPTIVMRPRGPSTAQKLVAFMAMLVLVTACGIAVIIWRKPVWLGLAPPEEPAPTAAHAPPGKLAAAPSAVVAPVPVGPVPVAPAAIPTTTTTALPSAPSASAAPVKKPKRAAPPRPTPQP